jgi:hypothetical protein
VCDYTFNGFLEKMIQATNKSNSPTRQEVPSSGTKNPSIPQLSDVKDEPLRSSLSSNRPDASKLPLVVDEALNRSGNSLTKSVRENWNSTNAALDRLSNNQYASSTELDEDLKTLGRAIKREASTLRELAQDSKSQGGIELSPEVRSLLSERWKDIHSAFATAKSEHQQLQTNQSNGVDPVLADSAQTLVSLHNTPRLSPEVIKKGPPATIEEPKLPQLQPERPQAPELLSEESKLGTHSYEISQGIAEVDQLKKYNTEQLVRYLEQQNPTLAQEVAQTRQELEQYLADQGMSKNYRIEGPVADIDESLPEMRQDTETGKWSMAPDREPVLSVRWKVVAIERRNEQTNGMPKAGAHTFEQSRAWDRGEHRSTWGEEAPPTADATKHRHMIVSAGTQYQRLKDYPESQRTPAEQALCSAYERREFLQSKIIWPGDDGSKVLDTWSGPKTVYRELAPEEILAAKKEYFGLGEKIVGLMAGVAPESYQRQQSFVDKHTQRTIERVEERPVGYIQRNVAGYLTSKIGNWSLNRFPYGESVAQRISEPMSVGKLTTDSFEQFFGTSDGEVDRMRFEGQIRQFEKGIHLTQAGRERIASRASNLLTGMSPREDGTLELSPEKYSELNSELLQRRSQTMEERTSAARMARVQELSSDEKVNISEEQMHVQTIQAETWQAAKELTTLGDERESRAASMKNYGIESILSRYWGAHVDRLPEGIDSKISEAFSAITTVETYPVHRQDGSVRTLGENVSGDVPLGHPVRTGSYLDIFDGRHSGDSSFLIPVGRPGLEVGYITVNRSQENGAWEYKLYELEGSPMFDTKSYSTFLNSSRDPSGYRESSIGQILASRGEEGMIASGLESVAKAAQELWEKTAASRIPSRDHAYLML